MKSVLILMLTICLFSCTQRKYLSNILPENTMPENYTEGLTLLFIASDECGYCLTEVPLNNQLYEKYSDEINFISLYESDSSAASNVKVKELGYSTSEIVEWEKMYSSQDLINKIWVKKLFPQVHIYIDGIHKKSIVGSTKKNQKRLKSYIEKYLRAN